MVITAGGLHGKIAGLTDTIVTLEIADKVRVKVSRGQVSGLSEIKPSEPKKKK
jgi:preprotein translocase subunit YajC